MSRETLDPIAAEMVGARSSVLVLGATGLLGRTLVVALARSFRVIAAARSAPEHASRGEPTIAWAAMGMLTEDGLPWLTALVERFRPRAIINAIGHCPYRGDPDGEGRFVNGIYPHRFHERCRILGVNGIHISTDAVFSGWRGTYREEDIPDPVDAYGRWKLVGELDGDGAVTLRTSFIALDDPHHRGLVGRFLAQTGRVSGYRRVRWSGLTVQELARVIELLIRRREPLTGVWHCSGAPITKHDLLRLLQERFRRHDLIVDPDDSVVCDRTLDSSRLRAALEWQPPSWDALIDDLVQTQPEGLLCRP